MVDLDTGDAVRMDTASRVAVGGVGGPDHGTVGMARDQDASVFLRPFGELFLGAPFLFIIL